jgi:DNA ligase-associated metallophosphoesterase
MMLELCGEALELDPAGLLHWPAQGLVAVADLHLEKGSAFARRGLMLPPYDTHATLLRLEAVLERLRPRTVVSLGDSFHDRRGAELLEPELARQVRRLTGSVEWMWVRGNHDPDPPAGLGGRAVAELSVAGLFFRHAPCGEAGEVAGHLHPKARLVGTRLRLSRPCYVSDGLRLVLPAFGSYTGGLDVTHPAIAGLFPDGFAAMLLGAERVFRVPHDRLEAWQGVG